MHTTVRFVFPLLGALILFSSASAWAGRDPTDAERAGLEAALRAAGYEQWDDIELDDGVWKVDDARTADGRKFDLKLNPETLALVEREED